jgi:hypothetical protein
LVQVVDNVDPLVVDNVGLLVVVAVDNVGPLVVAVDNVDLLVVDNVDLLVRVLLLLHEQLHEVLLHDVAHVLHVVQVLHVDRLPVHDLLHFLDFLA